MANWRESLIVELTKAVVPVVVGGLLAFGGTWYGLRQAHEQWERSNALEDQRAHRVQELERKTIALTHSLEWQRTSAERILVLRTQYISEFMGQAALCAREAEQNATSEQNVSLQEYLKEMRKLQTMSEAAGLFVSDSTLGMMTELVRAIRRLNIVMAKQQPSVPEMKNQMVQVQDVMDNVRVRLRSEIMPPPRVGARTSTTNANATGTYAKVARPTVATTPGASMP